MDRPALRCDAGLSPLRLAGRSLRRTVERAGLRGRRLRPARLPRSRNTGSQQIFPIIRHRKALPPFRCRPHCLRPSFLLKARRRDALSAVRPTRCVRPFFCRRFGITKRCRPFAAAPRGGLQRASTARFRSAAGGEPQSAAQQPAAPARSSRPATLFRPLSTPSASSDLHAPIPSRPSECNILLHRIPVSPSPLHSHLRHLHAFRPARLAPLQTRARKYCIAPRRGEQKTRSG